MPTVLRLEGFRFLFYASDAEEPPHVHVARGDGYAKLWLTPRCKRSIFTGTKPASADGSARSRHNTAKTSSMPGPTSSANRYDALEAVIIERGLRISGVHPYPELGLLVFVLNDTRTLRYPLAASERLRAASPAQLAEVELVGGGVAAHWPAVDEDTSLKGLLKRELSAVPSLTT